MEADVSYYRRRIAEELVAADRAVTDAGRSRHLQLVRSFLMRLEELGERLPLTYEELARLQLERAD